MSGGVDSLRAAILLKQQGHELIGLHMRLVSGSTGEEPRAGLPLRQEEDLGRLAGGFGIPLRIVDLVADFEARVIASFLAAYLDGMTPNPCVVCNPQIKFGALLRKARQLGAEFLATGHYARIAAPGERNGRWGLRRARDPGKDQSYFLYGLTQEQLASALFPLGDVLKSEVLRWAEEEGIRPEIPPESQEICFIQTGSYLDFVRKRVDLSRYGDRGPIVDLEGRILGEHKGIFAYTVGQRRGLGIASSAPYYVVDLDPASNTVTVGRAHDLYRQELRADRVNWVSRDRPSHPIPCQVRIRNQHRPAAAILTPLENARVTVRFREPQRAVTPGQAAVFYDGDWLLGGGTICRTP